MERRDRPGSPAILVGVISDTHGLLRPEATAALRGVDLIVHAGDVGGPEILDQLRQIAPVVAVRGNTDAGEWGETLPVTDTATVGGVLLHVLHEVGALDVVPSAAGIRVVISGHTHRPQIVTDAGVLFVNPGSAGPRRFRLPVSIARLRVDRDQVTGEIVELAVDEAARPSARER
jgi:putative phosphoesterase